MVVLAIVVLGLVSMSRVPVDLYPDIEFPWVTVISSYPGAGPEEIETLVTKPLEDAVSTISGVKNVTSTSEEGLSVVSIEFYLGTKLDAATNDVREKVDAAGFELPRDMDPPVIQKFSLSASSAEWASSITARAAVWSGLAARADSARWIARTCSPSSAAVRARSATGSGPPASSTNSASITSRGLPYSLVVDSCLNHPAYCSQMARTSHDTIP